jgi:hypothetical protein
MRSEVRFPEALEPVACISKIALRAQIHYMNILSIISGHQQSVAQGPSSGLPHPPSSAGGRRFAIKCTIILTA